VPRFIRRLALVSLVLLAGLLLAQGDGAPKGKKYALLVGVSYYKNVGYSPLRGTENDVVELAKVLRRPECGFEVTLLTSTPGHKDPKVAPTAANIRKELARLLKDKGREDTVLIALAGHGADVEVPDPEKKLPAKTYTYFFPTDADDLESISHSTGHSDHLIELGDLFNRLEAPGCGAGVKLVLVDACRDSLKATSSVRSLTPTRVTVPAGVSALFSCGPRETALETGFDVGGGEQRIHGVFFWHVLEALGGNARNADGTVNWDDLSSHVRRKVPAFVRDVAKRKAPQRPHGINNMEDEVVLLRPPAEAGGEQDYRRGRGLYLGLGTPVDERAAVPHFRRASEKGHALARAYLAFCYDYGRGVAKDEAEARRQGALALPGVRRLAEGGDADARWRLGILYLEGLGVPRDPKEAVSWVRKAAEQGHAGAQNNLGWMYDNGRGVEKDHKEALRWYGKAAEQGHARGLSNLGWMYDNGRGVGKDPKEAVRWYRKAAEQNEPSAQHNLGISYREGQGVEKDDTEAVRWFRKAAEQGHAGAQNNLGWMYDNGRGVEKDHKEALRWYGKAAEQGHADAQDNLGVSYRDGEGVGKDYKEALRWCKKAAEQGHSNGQFNVGDLHERGLGVEKDPKEALRWYRKAAEQGHERALGRAAEMCEGGRGGDKDYGEALKWRRKGAGLGHSTAMNALGHAYFYGRGTGKDESEAARWYRKAAEQGHAGAQFNLGWMYLNGRGVAKDRAEAARWFRKAADQGHAEAKAKLASLE
jgi:TPR repeat protein